MRFYNIFTSISTPEGRFKFINADYAGTEAGTFAQPYNTLSDMNAIGNNFIIYLRAATATYNFRSTGSYHHGGSLGQFRYVNRFASSADSVQFLGYPGEAKPIIDGGKGFEPVLYSGVNTTTNEFTVGRWGDIWATGDAVEVQARRCTYNGSSCTSEAAGTLPSPLTTAPYVYYVVRVDATHIKLSDTYAHAIAGTDIIDITTTGDSGTLDNYTIFGGSPFWKTYGSPVYYDGIAFQNMPNKGLNFINDNDYRVIRNNTFTNQYGGGNGMNSGMIDTEGNTTCADPDTSEFAVIQNNIFTGANDSALVKIYAHWKLLIEGNTFSNSYEGVSGVAEGLALKGGCMTQLTVRSNVIHDISTDGLAGNNNTLSGGEYLYNVIYDVDPRALRVNQNEAMILPFYYERNSICGPIELSDTALAGNFNFVQNVIVNTAGAGSPAGITFVTSNFSHVVMTNNLTGVSADGIVDSTCNLQGSYRTSWLGTRGYELADTTVSRRYSGRLFLRR